MRLALAHDAATVALAVDLARWRQAGRPDGIIAANLGPAVLEQSIEGSLVEYHERIVNAFWSYPTSSD